MKTIRPIEAAAVLSALLLYTSCLYLCLDGIGLKPPPESSLASPATLARKAGLNQYGKDPVPPPTMTPAESADQINAPLLAVVGLLLVWLFSRSYLGAQVKKPGAQLDTEDLALIRVASDALDDFWHRQKTKDNPKIIPFPNSD